jgi:hypothetical protein
MTDSNNIFNQFYNTETNINSSEYEIVKSYFDKFTTDPSVSATYTETLLRIASETQIPVIELLETFDLTDELKVNLTFAYYLNNINKTKTTLYGVANNLKPVEIVQRNIVH